MSAFQRSEYEQRLAATRSRMRERGLDLLCVTTPENINYLSGYAGWSFYTSQALLVGAAAADPVLVVRDMDVACARYTSFLPPSQLVGYPEHYIGGDLHPMDFIAQTARERYGSLRRVGIEPDGCFFPVTSFERLRHQLSDAELVDSKGLINWLRTVKSAAEIAVMREAAAIASAAIRTAQQSIEVGVRECDAAAEIYRTLIRGMPGYGGTVPASFTLVSGARTTAPHIAWTDQRFAAGQSVNLELGGSRHQYHAGLSRSFYLGTPPARLARLGETVVAGMNAALEVVLPGRTCADVAAAWQRVIAAAGYEKKSRIGYSIGIGFQPTWLDCTASLQAGDHTVLEPDMTFHMICGMWKDADNLVLSETFRVTAGGHEVLTQAPRELLVRS